MLCVYAIHWLFAPPPPSLRFHFISLDFIMPAFVCVCAAAHKSRIECYHLGILRAVNKISSISRKITKWTTTRGWWRKQNQNSEERENIPSNAHSAWARANKNRANNQRSTFFHQRKKSLNYVYGLVCWTNEKNEREELVRRRARRTGNNVISKINICIK